MISIKRGYLRGAPRPALVECPLCERPFGATYYERYHRDDVHAECSCGRWLVALHTHLSQMRRWHPDQRHAPTGYVSRPTSR